MYTFSLQITADSVLDEAGLGISPKFHSCLITHFSDPQKRFFLLHCWLLYPYNTFRDEEYVNLLKI